VNDAAQAAISIMPRSRFIGTVFAIGLFDAGLLGAVCISLASSWAFGEVFGWAHSLNRKIKEAPWFYAYYFFDLLLAGSVVLIPRAPAGADHLVCADHRNDASAGCAGVPHHPAERQKDDGKVREHALGEHRQHHDCCCGYRDLDALRGERHFSQYVRNLGGCGKERI